jgi:hypothetical protein
VYRGFGSSSGRSLPEEYGLLSLWRDPGLSIRKFFRARDGTPSMQDFNMSLWEAGNLLTKSARALAQNGERMYGLATNASKTIGNDSDALYLLYNNPRAIIAAYQQTLDSLMQRAIYSSKEKNVAQLIILGVEGFLFGVVITAVLWVLASRLVQARYAVFTG